MNLKTLLLALSLLLALALPILPTKAGMTVPNPNQYRYVTFDGPKTLDPAWAYDNASREVIFNVYQCLMDFDFVYDNKYVDEIADWWPGKGENPGNIITPLPPDPWTFDATGVPRKVNLTDPVCTWWTRKCIPYHLKAWEDNGNGILDYCDQVTMTWVYDNRSIWNDTGIDLTNPDGTYWYDFRSEQLWDISNWSDTNGNHILDYCDYVYIICVSGEESMEIGWFHIESVDVIGSETTIVLGSEEELEFHVDKVIEFCGTYYELVLQPKFYDSTWKFHIRKDVKWQDPDYGSVNPFDVEVTLERGMLMDHSSGPQWMFFDPLTNSFGTRDGTWNWPGYKYYDSCYPNDTARLARWIDDAIESDEEFVWFNLVKPYMPFMQILCQSWGSVMSHKWLYDIGAWDLGWHIPCHTMEGYLSWINYNNPPTPGPVGNKAMGSGPYYIDYIDLSTGYYRLEKFDNYYFGWDKPHCDTIIHQVGNDWEAMLSAFLSDDPATQVDQIPIPLSEYNNPDLLAAIDACKVRYLPNLPKLEADAIFFAYDFDDSKWPHYIGDGAGGWIRKSNLLGDIHMRLALAYCWSATEFIQDCYQGEAATLHNPIIRGIAYSNETKHSMMSYTKNIALATYHFQQAWGGQVWQRGFRMQIEPFPNVPQRTIPCYIMKDIVENEIEWPIGVTVEIRVNPVDWKTGILDMSAHKLGAWVCGWIGDYPDPHNWVFPFMHTQGDFSSCQNIHYGHDSFGNVVPLNWHPKGNYGQNGLPYTNYNGDLVTEINNTYVDGLIETGIGIVDPDLREKCYTELMDIYYAECASVMICQPLDRHYERTWVHGWFFNPAYPGKMFYGTCHTMNIWKQDPQTYTRDLKATADIPWSCKDRFILSWDIHNLGDGPENFVCNITWWNAIGVPFSKIVSGWVRKDDIYYEEIDPYGTAGQLGPGGAAIKVDVELSPWVGHYVNDRDPTDNKITLKTVKKYGDLGGGVPPRFFRFDGACTGGDFALFLMLFKGYNPFGDP